MLFSSIALAGLTLPLFSSAAPHSKAEYRRSFENGPLMSQNFPDPSFIEVNGVYYAFATNSNGARCPVATSNDFQNWSLMQGHDALPQVGAWSDGSNIWAPDVIQRPDGTFVMYYSAEVNGKPGFHCIGAATSSNPAGPYTPVASSLACPTSQGGAIDAAGFQDADGTMYVVYKIDGNNIGHGGSCGNSVAPIVPTPIMLQRLQSDGVTPDGSPQQILTNGQYDGPLVEAPSLSRIADSTSAGGWMYILFFSSNCYSTSLYDVSYAISTNGIWNNGGNYVKSTAPLMVTGADNNKLYAPGGLDSSINLGSSSAVLWHADQGTTSDTRQMWGGHVSVNIGARTVSI